MPVCTQCGRKHSIFSHAIGTTLCTKCQKISQLRAKLTDDNPVVRAQVAAELFKLGDDTAHDLLIAALQDQRTSVFAVIAFNERGRFDELIPYLNKVLLDVKNTWALFIIVKLLCLSDSPNALNALVSLIANRSPSEFASVKGDTSMPSIVVLGADGNTIYMDAVERLGMRGGQESVSALKSLLDRGVEPSLRDTVTMALDRMKKRGLPV